MEEAPIIEERTYTQAEISGVPLNLNQNDLLQQLLSQSKTTNHGASVPSQVPTNNIQTVPPPEQHIQAKSQYTGNSEIDSIIASLVQNPVDQITVPDEPTVPVKMNLMQSYEEIKKRLAKAKDAADLDLNQVPEPLREKFAALKEQAERGNQIDENNRREAVAKLQAAIDGWIPTMLAHQRANGLKDIDTDALEKYLSMINVHQNPGSQALNDFVLGASKQVQDLQQQRRKDVNESNQYFQKAKALAKKYKELEQETVTEKKKNEQLQQQMEKLQAEIQQIKTAQQQAAAAQPQYIFPGSQQQTAVTPVVHQYIPAATAAGPAPTPQYTVTTQQASMTAGTPATSSLENVFFNASVYNGGLSRYGVDEALQNAKTTARIFNELKFQDPENPNIRAIDLYDASLFKRQRV